ncbi:PASTA domain-containing protein [Krasilnikovia sp. MM14-A1004]|uniref:PASTA domain-containing protein n=1 Tax=Krasilnikovia sp. MM14-A1004 TaxID=3373541 RepID=UPI00399CE24B
MSDEQGRRREPVGEGSEPDKTHSSGPGPVAGNHPDDGPRTGDAAGPGNTDRMAGADETAAMPALPADDEPTAQTAGPPPGDEPTVSASGPPAGDDPTTPMPTPAGDDATTPMPTPAGDDATTVMPTPVGDDATAVRPGAPVDDATTVMPTPAGDDATAVRPVADDATRVMGSTGDDATAVLPGSRGDDATAVLPSSGSAAGWGAAWGGRAEVRPPRPSAAMGDTREEWAIPAAREPRGRWWMPVLVGFIVVALLALLGWGVYQILRAVRHDDEVPAPVVTTSAAAPPSTAPSSAPSSPPSTAPSSAPTTSTPATTEPPTEVTVPALKGLSVQDARQALERTGLAYRIRFMRSDSPAGTVIDSDPAEGQQVPPDTTVTLIVAAPPASSAVPSSTPTGTSGQPNGG